jgi:hypothetical protein
MLNPEMQQLKSRCCILISLHPRRYPPRHTSSMQMKPPSSKVVAPKPSVTFTHKANNIIIYNENLWIGVSFCVRGMGGCPSTPTANDSTCTSPPHLLLRLYCFLLSMQIAAAGGKMLSLSSPHHLTSFFACIAHSIDADCRR